MLLWHGGHDNDSNQASDDDEEQTNMLQWNEESVAEDDESGARPEDEDEGDIGMPRLIGVVRVEDGIHLNDDVGWDGDDGGQIEDPCGNQ